MADIVTIAVSPAVVAGKARNILCAVRVDISMAVDRANAVEICPTKLGRAQANACSPCLGDLAAAIESCGLVPDARTASRALLWASPLLLDAQAPPGVGKGAISEDAEDGKKELGLHVVGSIDLAWGVNQIFAEKARRL